MKQISFAVPCYNSAQYMDKCISTLLKAGETYREITTYKFSTR